MNYLLLILLFIFTACSNDDATTDEFNSNGFEAEIYYGDVQNDRVLVINRHDMTLENTLVTGGIYPYEVSQAYNLEVYVINRDDFKIDVITNKTFTSTISMPFKPRSFAGNVVSGVDEPAANILGNSTVYKDSDYVTPSSYGGSNATGHPFIVNENYFLLLDRTENTIELYQEGDPTPVSKLTTTSSVHHLMKKDGYYYGVLEGEQNVSAPGILKFSVTYAKIEQTQERLISEFTSTVIDINSSTWGAHHGAIHPDGGHIYFGSREGNIFVLRLDDLSLVDNFSAGLGVGHLAFYGYTLYSTNHFDNFKSFYNASNPQNNVFIKNLQLSTATYSSKIMQSHTTHIIDHFMYFMFNDDQNSTFFKVNMNTLEIDSTINIQDNYSLMGTTLTYTKEPIGGM